MGKHYKFSDLEFEMHFKKCSLDPELFSHEAHLRLAWIHINKYGLDMAIKNICVQLRDFVASFGAQDKFNKTLTVAAINAVYHFMQRSNSENFRDFINAFPLLKDDFKKLIGCHYKMDFFQLQICFN